MPLHRFGRRAAALMLAAATAPPRAANEPEGWPAIKCARYCKIWSRAMARMGPAGLGPALLARHEAFLAWGCSIRAEVCARSDREIELANALMAMNAGMAGTLPHLPAATEATGYSSSRKNFPSCW